MVASPFGTGFGYFLLEGQLEGQSRRHTVGSWALAKHTGKDWHPSWARLYQGELPAAHLRWDRVCALLANVQVPHSRSKQAQGPPQIRGCDCKLCAACPGLWRPPEAWIQGSLPVGKIVHHVVLTGLGAPVSGTNIRCHTAPSSGGGYTCYMPEPS